MKTIVGVIGFLLVFAVAYVVVTIALVNIRPTFLVENFPIALQSTYNPVAFLAALFAGTSSYLASTRTDDEATKRRNKIVSRIGYAIVLLIAIAVYVLMSRP